MSNLISPGSNMTQRTSAVTQLAASVLLCLISAPCVGRELHRPVAVEQLPDGRICVLNQSAGSLSLVDPESNNVIEHSIAKLDGTTPWLTDFALVDASHCVVLDGNRHELLSIRISDEKVEVLGRVAVDRFPVDVVARGKHAYVSSLWSRRWSIVRLDDTANPKPVKSVDLPFSPRHQIVLNDDAVLVLDAFGGHWATIDSRKAKVLRVGNFIGSHNITGVAFDAGGEHLVIPHMTLNAEKPTTKFNVHWGDVILNVVRKVPVSSFLGDAEIADDLYYLGRPDIAAGDPTGILVTKDNRQIVCFSGTSEVGVSDRGANSFDRIHIGCRPSAMTMNADETVLFVANQLDDSISVINIADRKLTATIPLTLGTDGMLTAVQEGERLFYDSTLSSDGWFSCHSCHTDGHTSGGLADTFSDGATGDAKRVPTLRGVRDTTPWSWRGSATSLKEQIHKSVVTTMRGPALTHKQTDSLTAFVRTLESVPSVMVARGTIDKVQAARGLAVFESVGCADCHSGEQYTSPSTYTVGFKDESGNDQFNPPSLRAVSQRHRLLHDNRATSVQNVIEQFAHQNDGTLTEGELRDLVYFVEGL